MVRWEVLVNDRYRSKLQARYTLGLVRMDTEVHFERGQGVLELVIQGKFGLCECTKVHRLAVRCEAGVWSSVRLEVLSGRRWDVVTGADPLALASQWLEEVKAYLPPLAACAVGDLAGLSLEEARA